MRIGERRPHSGDPSTAARHTAPRRCRGSTEIPQLPKALLLTTEWAFAIHAAFGTLGAAGGTGPETGAVRADTCARPAGAPLANSQSERAAPRDCFDRRSPSYRTIALARG